MRTTIISLCFFLQVSLGFGQGLVYTFSGRVSHLFYDGGGILAAENLAIGDSVSASFTVDFNAPGYYLLNDGTIDVPVDPPLGNVRNAYFYCSLSSATLLSEVNGGYQNRPQDVRDYFIGWNSSGPTGNEGLLWGGTGDSYFTVRKSSGAGGSSVQAWQVGTGVRGVIVAYSDLDWSIAWADMTLDSITAVPEPSALLLIPIGGLVWFVMGRNRAKVA